MRELEKLKSVHKTPLRFAAHVLKKRHPEVAERAAKPLVGFKYTKITLLVISIFFAYYLFSNPVFHEFTAFITGFGLLSILIAGLLFSYGFTTPFAIAMFVTMNPENIIIASLIGGFGAFMADLFIFKMIKYSFSDEFDELKKTKIIHKLGEFIERNVNSKVKLYLIYFCAGFIIASPFPDEVAVAMLAGFTTINPKIFSIISFSLNTIGIFILLLI